ncbi:MAG: chemotaxis protein CheC [Lachnospiraceae bacterium]|nr:chemotaxis protein CheC [Lachnospiraceae bacterium]
MFDRIFGNYLVNAGHLTKEQLAEVIEAESTTRVKLGLIAVAEKLMTQEQADEVNHLQTVMDKRFGDIAVSKGYLTDDQVSSLLKKQGNIYMLFVQTVTEKGFMSIEEIDESLSAYQDENGLTHTDMDDLLSGDVDRTVRLFLPQNDALYDRFCALAVRTLIRVINSGAYVSKAFLVDEIYTDRFAMQKVEGDHNISAGFAGVGDGLLCIAEPFADEEFDSVDLDALDAVGEFMNCVNGLFATELSNENVDIDMLPPEFFDHPVHIKGKQFCVFPIYIGEGVVNFILAIDESLEVS